MRLIGKIKRVVSNGAYGFIDLKTVGQFGAPDWWRKPTFPSSKDIFIHADDLSVPLEVGVNVTFEVQDDTKRKDALRAVKAMLAVRGATGIEVHVDPGAIDNPSVPARWCLTGNMRDRIVQGLKEGHGYAVLLVSRLADRDEMGFHEVREIKDPLQPFTILGFSKPGKWEVCAILFERQNQADGRDTSHNLKLDLRRIFLGRSRHARGHFERDIGSFSGIFLESDPVEPHEVFHVSEYRDAAGGAIGMHAITVDIPKEVFAPAPSPAATAFVNYFFRRSPADECQFRRRASMMVLGFFPWLFLEALKRVLNVPIALIMASLCIRGSWKLLAASLKPSVNFAWDPLFDEYCEEHETWSRPRLWKPWDKIAYGMAFTPLAIIGWAALLVVVLWLGWFLLGLLFAIIAGLWIWVTNSTALTTLVLGLLALFAVIALIKHVQKTKKAQFKKVDMAEQLRLSEEGRKAELRRKEELRQRTAERAQSRVAVAEQYASALVCGDAPKEVSLRAVPAKLRTFGMWTAAVKRQVCRPFG